MSDFEIYAGLYDLSPQDLTDLDEYYDAEEEYPVDCNA